MKVPNAIGLVFPYNEVNAAVFQNAGLWAVKNNFGSETTVYSPNHFRSLYFAVDKLIDVKINPYINYSEVSEFEPNSISKNDYRTWFSKGTTNFIRHEFLNMLPKHLFHALPMQVRSDYKTRKFLLESGIYEFAKRDYYSNNLEIDSLFLGDGLYFNLGKFEKIKKNLKLYFQYSFENLYNMILSRNLNSVNSIIKSQQLLIETPLQFLKQFNSNFPKILLRTRNIKSNVSWQNAPRLELSRLVKELLAHGCVVINTGITASNLNIEHKNYLEFSNNLSTTTEMHLANHCDYIMNTAWAGLFTGYASYNKPLITFDSEWSLTNIIKPVSLLEARKTIGMKDIDISATFSRNKYAIRDSARKITSSI